MGNIVKKIIFFIVILFVTLNISFAQASVKVTQVVFDDSDNLIFLPIQSQAVVPPQKILLESLDNPKRIYFDIEDAVLAIPNNTWTFKNSKLNQVKIAQTSVEPDVVRIVFTTDIDKTKFTVMKLPNGVVVRYDTDITKNDYLSELYRDTSSSVNDYLEKTIFIDESEMALIKNVDESFNKINEKLISQKTTESTKKTEIKPQNLTISDNVSKISTKYYMNRVDIKRGNILVSGIGSASLQKAKVLTEPNRVVYDMPNTILNPKIRNNEYKISETDSVRVGQFEQSKARIVITTNDTTKYRPIFSQDLQGILFAHSDKMDNIRLFNKTSLAQNYTIKHSDKYDILTINFSEPIIQSIVRNYSNLDVIIYNVKPIPATFFTTNLKSTLFSNIKVEKIPNTDKYLAGQRLTIPIDKYDTVYAYESQHGKQLVLKIEGQKVIEKAQSKTTQDKTPTPRATRLNKNKMIIIDAGHGGADVGATREGIYEKDINLDVAKKVAEILKKSGYKVEMTRTGDTNPTLQERCEFAEAHKATIFVSIHTNASLNVAANGIETHYYHDDSYELAQKIQRNLVKNTKGSNRGTIKSMFYVINHTSVPAVLVEMGYISNEEERKSMLTEERKNNTAKAIADGIIDYMRAQK